MSKREATTRTRIREQPALTAAPRRTLEIGDEMVPTGNKSDDGLWIEVEVFPGAGVTVKGWVLLAHTDATSQAQREPIDIAGFVQTCIDVERAFNLQPSRAPWFAMADFVIARAIIETKISNADTLLVGTDAIGPFQMTSEEWAKFLAEAPSTPPILPQERDDPITQIRGATYRMHRDAKAISALQAQRGVGTAEDPFIPSLLDLFHAYLANSPKVAVAIIEALKNPADHNQTIDVIAKRAIGEEELAKLVRARSATPNIPATLAQLVARTEAALNEALKQAHALIVEHCPEELTQVSQGEAPWFDVAQKAKDDGIDEHNPAHKNIILDYFKSTSMGRPNNIVHWCGAFAAHCMDASGLKSSIPTNAQAAVNWKKWGSEISFRAGDAQSANLPQGAVVVLSPSEGTGTTGHVGFFVRFHDKFVELLGGNQSDKVKLSSFLISKIAAVRWLDSAPLTKSEQLDGAPSGTAISEDAIKLIVFEEVTSEQRYEERFRKPIWPGGQSGVTVGIGYDVGHQTKQKVADDWNGHISANMVARLQTACGVTGAAARPLARQLSDVDVPFATAMAVFRQKSVPRWVGIVQRALPNTGELSGDSLGALVSLTYNRGASYDKQGDRFREMRAIKQKMGARQFAQIPDEFLSMRRLWPDLPGLQKRRKREADLFQRGLS